MNIFSLGRKHLELRKEFDAHVKASEEKILAIEKALQDTRDHYDRELEEMRGSIPKRSSARTFQQMRRMAEDGARRAMNG